MAAESIARAFHEAYEDLAPSFGYRTREASAKPWDDVPDQNKALMIATVDRLLKTGVIRTPPSPADPIDRGIQIGHGNTQFNSF